MKTFLVVAAVASLAIIFVEISQSNAQREDRRCEGEKPNITSADKVKCDRFQGFLGIPGRRCQHRCRECYNRTELSRRRQGCLANRKCVCLGKKGNSTTENPIEPTTTEGASTALPTTVLPSTTQRGEETTVPAGETTVVTEPAPTTAAPIE